MKQTFKGLPFKVFVNRKNEEIGYYTVGKVIFPQKLMYRAMQMKKEKAHD